MLEQLLAVKDQIPAIGRKQRTGFDHGVIGVQKSVVALFFDPAEQIAVGGIGFINHRSAFLFGIIDQHVDLVFVHP